MADAVIGEIRAFAGNYAPEGWLLCEGQQLSANTYPALFSLISYTYGGSGTTFKLPDLRGRLPVGQGQGANLTNRVIGQTGGTSTVALTEAAMPPHSHDFVVSGTQGSTNAVTAGAALAVPQVQAGGTMYAYATPGTGTAQVFPPAAIGPAPGGGQPHANLMPYLAINYIMAADGLYPNRP